MTKTFNRLLDIEDYENNKGLKTTYNMGIGYCLVVPAEVAVEVELRIYGHGYKSWTIGQVVEDDI